MNVLIGRGTDLQTARAPVLPRVSSWGDPTEVKCPHQGALSPGGVGREPAQALLAREAQGRHRPDQREAAAQGAGVSPRGRGRAFSKGGRGLPSAEGRAGRAASRNPELDSCSPGWGSW